MYSCFEPACFSSTVDLFCHDKAVSLFPGQFCGVGYRPVVRSASRRTSTFYEFYGVSECPLLPMRSAKRATVTLFGRIWVLGPRCLGLPLLTIISYCVASSSVLWVVFPCCVGISMERFGWSSCSLGVGAPLVGFGCWVGGWPCALSPLYFVLAKWRPSFIYITWSYRGAGPTQWCVFQVWFFLG